MHDPFARHGNIFRSDKIALPGWEAGREISKPMHEEKSLTIARAFAGAASYDEHAMVQRSVATELARTISLLSIPADARILEIGCGTGFLGEALIRHLPSAHWLMTDLTREMLIRAEKRLAGSADIQFSLMDGQMPDLDGHFDLICSSLAFQWFADLPLALDRLSRLLSKGGWLAFTTLAQGCFSEWRDAHQGEACGLADYPSAEALQSLGLEVTVRSYPMQFESAAAFLRHLKGIGAHVPRAGYRPASPARLKLIMRRFEAENSRVSYRVATCLMQA